MQKEMQHCTAGRAAFHGGSAGGKLARVQMWPPYESVVFMLVALNAEQQTPERNCWRRRRGLHL